MSEVLIAPGIKMSAADNTDLPPNSAELQRVWLWDIGPAKPVAPKRPPLPEILKKGKEGDPEYDLAKIEVADQIEEYQTALKAWKTAKEEYAKWQKDMGGPIERMFWSCDASDALARDPTRYFISARTRGHAGKPNGGLPDGMKPGHGQAEQDRRQREGEVDIAAALKADPYFGQQELRA